MSAYFQKSTQKSQTAWYNECMDANCQTIEYSPVDAPNAHHGRIDYFVEPGTPGYHDPAVSRQHQMDMASQPRRFMWDHKRTRAADLMTDTRYSERDICDMTGLAMPELRWLQTQPDFMDAFEAAKAEQTRRVMNTGVASREFRINQLNRRHQLLSRLMDQRSASMDPESEFFDAETLGVPGVDTGLLVKKTRGIGSGPTMMIVNDFELDRGLLSAFKEIEEHVGKETGQLMERRQIEVVQKMYIGVNIDDV